MADCTISYQKITPYEISANNLEVKKGIRPKEKNQLSSVTTEQPLRKDSFWNGSQQRESNKDVEEIKRDSRCSSCFDGCCFCVAGICRCCGACLEICDALASI